MLKGILLVLGTLLSCIVAIIYWSSTAFHAQYEPFEVSRWIDLREYAEMNDPGCIRGGMALGLIRSDLLIGLSKDSLRATLGDPSLAQADVASYALGQCRWDWRHSELAVHLGESDRVTRAEIRDTPFSVPALGTSSSVADGAP